MNTESITTPAEELSKAIAFALEVHAGQKDKGGAPYILHPLTVMMTLKSESDYQLMAIAVLHDTIEDSAYVIEDLRLMGFSDRVVKGVALLTRKEGQSYNAYIKEISTSVDATKVKLADLNHNLDITRLKHVSNQNVSRIDKYLRTRRFLLSKTYKEESL